MWGDDEAPALAESDRRKVADVELCGGGSSSRRLGEWDEASSGTTGSWVWATSRSERDARLGVAWS